AGNGRMHAAQRLDEHVRALDVLRLGTRTPAHAVLVERPDDEGVAGQPERRPRGGASPGRLWREVPQVDPDRDPEDLRGVDAARQNELVHLGVRDLDARELAVTLAEDAEAFVELRIPGRPGTAVEVRRGEAVRRPSPRLVQQRELAAAERRLATPGAEQAPVGHA